VNVTVWNSHDTNSHAKQILDSKRKGRRKQGIDIGQEEGRRKMGQESDEKQREILPIPD
jgi:hypothetical protein